MIKLIKNATDKLSYRKAMCVHISNLLYKLAYKWAHFSSVRMLTSCVQVTMLRTCEQFNQFNQILINICGIYQVAYIWAHPEKILHYLNYCWINREKLQFEMFSLTKGIRLSISEKLWIIRHKAENENISHGKLALNFSSEFEIVLKYRNLIITNSIY